MSAFGAASDAVHPGPEGPVQIQIDYPEKLSRLLIFVKWLLLIPHYIVLYVLGFVVSLIVFIAWFATIITGRYPRALFDFVVGFERWRLRVGSYYLLQTDAYPPFALGDDPSYPVRMQVEYPERVARWRPLICWLLAIPALIFTMVATLFAFLASIVAWFAILITGRYPRGCFDLVTYALTIGTKTVLYQYWATTRYPLG